MRTLKRGDIVSIETDKIAELNYLPGFPEKITSNLATIMDVWYLMNTDRKRLSVYLHTFPEMINLEFNLEDVTLVIPVELDRRLTAIENRLKELDNKPEEG